MNKKTKEHYIYKGYGITKAKDLQTELDKFMKKVKEMLKENE